MIEINNKFIQIAIEEANKSNHRNKVGCIIFDKKRIISKGHNYAQKSVKKLHPKFQRFPFSIHAEVEAIIKAKTDLKGMSLLVIRVNSDNQFRLSKPCINCQEYIKYVKIKKVYYSINNFPYIIEMED
jgi:deoxycytidylate deaminase